MPRRSAAQAELPDDIDALKALIEAQAAKIESLQHQLRLLLAHRYGSSSERVVEDDVDSPQLHLFNEAEALAEDDDESEADEASIEIPAHRRRRGHRRALPEHLPRIEILHDLDEAEKVCPHDGHALTVLGEESAEQLDIVPAKVRVLHHRRLKYSCPHCREYVVTAPMPPQPLPKSEASPGLLAWVASSKYLDAQPLYRLSRQLERLGVEVPRQTLASWMVRCGRELAQPVVNLLREQMLASGYVQCDETTVQVLKEPGRAAETKSYLWCQRGGEPERPVILFDYDPTRSREVPRRLLEGFSGILQTDAYEGYNAVVAESRLTHVLCFAHARRRFIDSLKAMGINPKKPPAKPPPAARRTLKGLGFIRHLYEIERRIRGRDPEERLAVRQAESVPVLEAMRAWVRVTRPKVLPSSPLGDALAYLERHWEGLTRYCEYGQVEIDNNLCENAVRPFCVGRRNWLFCDTVNGAKASANLYSLIETARANGLEPYAYLRHVFTEIPKAETAEAIEALLPLNLTPETLALVAS